MKKRIERAFGKNVYLLGKGHDGALYWLEEARFSCEWYWGFGYVETYTNNKYPQKARDIKSHQHFDGLFFDRKHDGHTNFNSFFMESTLNDKEVWRLLELMKTFYIMREYSDTIYRGGAHYTSNPISDIIKNEGEYSRINKVVIPALLKEVYAILGGMEE